MILWLLGGRRKLYGDSVLRMLGSEPYASLFVLLRSGLIGLIAPSAWDRSESMQGVESEHRALEDEVRRSGTSRGGMIVGIHEHRT